LEETNKFQNINVFLNRTKPYVQNGRNQSEEESNEFAKEIFESLEKYCNGYLILDAVENQASEHILNFAKQE
jgi:hypothetical protein